MAFRLTELADGCAGPKVRRLLLEKVFPRQAELLTVDKPVQQPETSA